MEMYNLDSVNMDTVKQSVEALLSEGKSVEFSPSGTSMYPLFVTPKDKAVVVPYGNDIKLKRGDVCVYRRKDGPLVIHRIVRVNGDSVWFCGDHHTEIEGPLPITCIKGKMTEFVRKGKRFSVNNSGYRFLAGLWLFIRPLRPFCIRLGHYGKVIIGKAK